MSEIYWITRIGILQGAFLTFMVLGILALIVLAIAYYADELYRTSEGEYDFKEKIKTLKLWRKWFYPTLIATVICVIGAIFTPTKKDLLLIYGVGSTIDYVKENENAKQLPDKTIQVLDKVLDEYLNKDKK